MGARTFFALLVLVLGGLFAWLNWPEVTRTAPLSLGFTRVEAPLGLVLLVALGVVTLLYLLFTFGLERRRYLDGKFQALREAEREELRALKEEVAETLEKHGNTLAAYIGELEDQILRLLGERKQDPGG